MKSLAAQFVRRDSLLREALGAVLAVVLIGIAVMPFGKSAIGDIGAAHTSLVSEFASFNTPAVLDGRVIAIAIDGDTVFVGGTFNKIQKPLGGEEIT